MTGADVALTGPIAVRLLPTPYLALGAGSVSAPGPDAPKLSFASARLELALVKLAGGAIRFADIQLEKPVLTVARGADGALRLPAAPSGRAETIGFDRLIVRDGQARIVSRANGAVREIAGVQFDAAAPSLDGPYQVSGQLSGPKGAPVAFRVASEKAGRSETPVRVSRRRRRELARARIRGRARKPARRQAQRASASRVPPRWRELSLSGDGPMPWRAVGRMSADLDRVAIEDADFRLGPDERALTAHGSASLTYGPPARLDIALKSKQANVDSLLRRKGKDAVAPARALAFFSRALAPALGRAGRTDRDRRRSLGRKHHPGRADAVRRHGDIALRPWRVAACALQSRPSREQPASGRRRSGDGRGGEVSRRDRLPQRRYRASARMGEPRRAGAGRESRRARRNASLSQRIDVRRYRSVRGRVFGPQSRVDARSLDPRRVLSPSPLRTAPIRAASPSILPATRSTSTRCRTSMRAPRSLAASICRSRCGPIRCMSLASARPRSTAAR